MERYWGYVVGAAGGALLGGLIGFLLGTALFLPPWSPDPMHLEDGEALLAATLMTIQAGMALGAMVMPLFLWRRRRHGATKVK